jgi:hypothetical protein
MSYGLAWDRKQSSWVLSWIISAYLIACSINVVPQLFQEPSIYKFVMTDTDQSVLACWAFLGFCMFDLVIGMQFYLQEIRLLEGWIHHTAYIFLLSAFIHLKMTNAFYMFCFCEIPTFIMATGILFPALKSKRLFFYSFAACRLVLFFYFSALYLIECPKYQAIASCVPVLLIGSSHAYWFVQMCFPKKIKNEDSAV